EAFGNQPSVRDVPATAGCRARIRPTVAYNIALAMWGVTCPTGMVPVRAAVIPTLDRGLVADRTRRRFRRSGQLRPRSPKLQPPRAPLPEKRGAEARSRRNGS